MKNRLGNKSFVDGVCFVLEEMFLLGYQDADSAVSLLKQSALLNYKDEIFGRIKQNNPDIYKEYILPII